MNTRTRKLGPVINSILLALLAANMQRAAREAPYRIYDRVWPSASLPS